MKKVIGLLMLIVQISYAQVGIGTTNPDPSSVLELNATDKGFLPPRMTVLQRDFINTPAEGLTIYNIDAGCLQFWNGSFWVNMCDETIASGPCSSAPTKIVFDGLTYKPVESDGRCWLDRNLGATQVALNATDINSYGDLYQWGRSADGHQLRTSAAYDADVNGLPPSATASGAWDALFIKISLNNDWILTPDNTLWQGDGGTNDPCPPGFRVPTSSELVAERDSWGAANQDSTGAMNSPLRLPIAGIRFKSDHFAFVGSIGYYRTSNTNSSDSHALYISSSTTSLQTTVRRAHAASIRCIKD
jgi:uncharacterized protein (TIGR02145 family)